jgi:hypothetical protein
MDGDALSLVPFIVIDATKYLRWVRLFIGIIKG